MAKYKATRQDIKSRYNVLAVGDGRADRLLTYETPFAYSTRAEGWACDYYLIDADNDIVISTGYAPTGKKINCNTLRIYDEKARIIRDNETLTADEKRDKIAELLKEWAQVARRSIATKTNEKRGGQLSTNSRQARENIRAYIINNYDDDCTDDAPEKSKGFEAIARYILKCFYREYVKGVRSAWRVSRESLFIEWTQGLPSALNCDYYLCRAVYDLGDILQETEEQRAKYTEEEAAKRLTHLIWRELNAAVNFDDIERAEK